MEHLPEDQKVVDLLSKLKQSNGGYPSDMLASRRQQYLKQIANVGLGIGVGAGLNSALKSGGNGAGTATTLGGKVLETVLIAAIVIETGTAAYLYRGKIADLISSYTSPNVQQAVSPPEDTASQNPGPDVVNIAPSVAASNTPLVTPSGTPAPGVAGSAGLNATPGPAGSLNGSNGNNGNQYGLTPKPVRTIDNNSGGNDNGGGGGNSGGGNSGKGGGNKKP